MCVEYWIACQLWKIGCAGMVLLAGAGIVFVIGLVAGDIRIVTP